MNQTVSHPCEILCWSVGDAPLARGDMVAAIGNFDGVHLGHQKVIDTARKAAAERGQPIGVVTFDPHPREFFRQDDAPFHLADRTEKDRLIAALGVDRIIHVTFDDNLRCTNAESFVTKVLPALGIRSLFAGTDLPLVAGAAVTLKPSIASAQASALMLCLCRCWLMPTAR